MLRLDIPPALPAERETSMNVSSQTLSEILRDPLIRQVMRADRVSLDELAQLLQDVSGRKSPAATINSISLPACKRCRNAR
jgi:hypothetical protein